jgi:gamma-glutamylaminecyclotransferase
MYVFLYGTLKKGYRNNSLMEGQKFIRNVETEPLYRLYDNGSYPMLVLQKNLPANSIKGELWEVTEKCAKKLDLLEGVPYLYKRAEIKLKDTEESPVIGYIYQRSIDDYPDCGDSWPPMRKKSQ